MSRVLVVRHTANFFYNYQLGNETSHIGFLKRINGKEPESLELKKRFANPKLTVEELKSLISDFVEYVSIAKLT